MLLFLKRLLEFSSCFDQLSHTDVTKQSTLSSPYHNDALVTLAQVKQAEQQAVIYQHETEAARLRQVAQGKDDVIGKFKQLVQDNQNAAEKLRQECER